MVPTYAAHDHMLPHPVSRTYQYKKITKPLLERKRRARINRCLEELRDLMMGALERVEYRRGAHQQMSEELRDFLMRALEAEGENINKLEKADILELTVKHLHRITRPKNAAEDVHRFQAGFSHCASEACGFLLSLPGLDADVGRRLVAHLGQCLTTPLSVQVPLGTRSFSPPISPQVPPAEDLSPTSAPATDTSTRLSSTPSVQDLSRPLDGLLMVSSEDGENNEREEDVWRPW